MRPVTVINPETGHITRSKIVPTTPCGKRGYTSRKVAKEQAAIQSKVSGEDIEAYKCKRGCACWHIGHVLPASLRQAG